MFRFSIRDMLWLMVVVAVLMAYLGESYRAATTAREAERQAVDAAKRAQRAMESRSKGRP